MKTQLEQNPNPIEEKEEKKAKQKRRRKKPAAQTTQPAQPAQAAPAEATETVAPAAPPKKKRTSPYPGQVMPSLFSRRSGTSVSYTHLRAHET